MIGRLAGQFQSVSTAWLVGASGLAFVLYAIGDRTGVLPAFCGDTMSAAALISQLWWQWLLFDPTRWALEWLLMIMAMMLPLLVQPVGHIARTTLRGRLPRTLFLFMLSYAFAWLPAAVLISAATPLLHWSLAPPLLILCMLVGALAWSGSPLAQIARNRAHRFPPLDIRGAKADRDCCRFGLFTGLWCTLACWPWMLVSHALPGRGPLLMLTITLVLVAERAMPPCRPAWQWPRVVAFLLAVRPYRALGRV